MSLAIDYAAGDKPWITGPKPCRFAVLGAAIQRGASAQSRLCQYPRLRLSVAEISGLTAAYYGLNRSHMESADRSKKIARPRMVAMYLARRLTTFSLPQIGRRFGRDHTTVLHAVARVCDLMQEDMKLARDVNYLEARFDVALGAKSL